MQPFRWAGVVTMGLVLSSASSFVAAAKPDSLKKQVAPPPRPSMRFTQQPSVQRSAVPNETDQSAALELIHRIYAREYANRSVQDRQALAARLLTEAVQTRDLPAARYMMLVEAGQLGARAGDVTTTMRAADLLDETYQSPPLVHKLPWLTILGQTAINEEILAAADYCLQAMQQAIEFDDDDAAQRLLGLAEGLARRAKSVALTVRVKEAKEELGLLMGMRDGYGQAMAVMKTTPTDPGANTTVGRFLCFVKGDWERGLPMLARGQDRELADVAERDLAQPADSGEQSSVAHRWWELSEHQTRLVASRLKDRAVMWYVKARPSLSGLSATLVDKRLAEWDAQKLVRQHLALGLSAELFGDIGFTNLVMRRIDPTIDFDFGDDAAAEGMPKDNFSIRWKGFLRIHTAGDYTFVAIANSSAKLLIDGKVLLDEPDLTRKRNGQSMTATFEPGMYPIEFDFSDRGGLAKARLLWIAPGQTNPVPIPAEALVHQQ